MAWHAPGLTTLRRQDYSPPRARIPFRIILKYFAQWMEDHQADGTVENYLLAQFHADASRRLEQEDLHAVIRTRPSLLILDGLDEVVETGLRARLLSRIQEFLERADQLRGDIQIIATSRPTGYTDQFSPERFWHLELQPMTAERVRDYAVRWVFAKVTIEEERRRVLETLSECQAEEHTKLLLTTPLQVSIVLVIIKDGGRPPAQREALFHDYWSTIFRRERAKGTGIIRSEETLLFSLHAFLGYLLHCAALHHNVRSLLPRAELEQHVIKFLRANDSRAKEKSIRQAATDIVQEATGRLVLLVEPEPGLFGFELRSIQEFFAAAYLSQSAKSTEVRFLRLRAIALSEHWRNVSLFFVGRIVRNFGGEAANVLELVCRPIDRQMPDIILKRGAWLALDIAADGALSNRDLQYGAVEAALSVVTNRLPRSKQIRLQTALARLSADDLREIVRPILRRLIHDCVGPTRYLEDLLEVFGSVSGSKKVLLDGLEKLLAGDKKQRIGAFRLAFRFKVDPRWLAERLVTDWAIFLDDTIRWLAAASPAYMQEVLQYVSLTNDRALQVTNAIAKFVGQGRGKTEALGIATSVEAVGEQIVLFCLCMQAVASAKWPQSGDIPLRGLTLRSIGAVQKVNAGALDSYPSEAILRLIRRKSLLPALRLALWGVYWARERPHGANVTRFVEDMERALQAGVDRELLRLIPFYPLWPLLSETVHACYTGDKKLLGRLTKALQEDRSVAISDAVQGELINLARTMEAEKWIEFVVALRIGSLENIKGLEPIASSLGITTERLIRMHVSYFPPLVRQGKKLFDLIRALEELLLSGRDGSGLVSLIIIQEELRSVSVREALTAMLIRVSRSMSKPVRNLRAIVRLFLALGRVGGVTATLARSIAKLIGRCDEAELGLHFFERMGVAFMEVWGAALRSRDLEIKKGVVRLWFLIQGPGSRERFQGAINMSVFSWRHVSRCFAMTELPRSYVITMLKACNVPIELEDVSDKVLGLMQSADESEVEAWQEFLWHSPSPDTKRNDWRLFLERILDEGEKYDVAIYGSALDRYGTIIAQMTPDLPHDDELGP